MQEFPLRESVSLQNPVFSCDLVVGMQMKPPSLAIRACASMVERREGCGDCGDMMGELQTVQLFNGTSCDRQFDMFRGMAAGFSGKHPSRASWGRISSICKHPNLADESNVRQSVGP
jgi:hypothetical protein